MNKSYYHFKKEEFDSIKDLIKGDIHRIWADEISKDNENLDNEEVFINYFEKYQHLITVDILSHDLKNASLDLSIDEAKIAAFIYKVRGSKYPFHLKKSMDKLWLQCHKDDDNSIENLIWLDVESIDELSVYKSSINRFMIRVSTGKGRDFRASKYSFPELLVEDGLQELLALISKK
ncbi:hypothetical protein [Pantoea agglomerans]